MVRAQEAFAAAVNARLARSAVKDVYVYVHGYKVVFENLKVYAGEVPVFWFPYLAQPLDAELGYHFIPGARSTWGAYLLNTYGIMLGEDGMVMDDGVGAATGAGSGWGDGAGPRSIRAT